MIIFWSTIGCMTLLAMGILAVPYMRASSSESVNVVYPILWMLVIPLLSISLYLLLGSRESIIQQQQVAMVNTEIKKLGSLENIILTLQQKIAADPDSQGWALLGRLYLKSERFKEASEAFAQANRLTPNQPEILIGYAQSLYFMHQQNLTAPARNFLNQALALQPNQPDAINLLAMDAYQQENYSAAAMYWEQLLPQLQQGSEEQQKLLQIIAESQKKAKKS